MMLGKNAPKAVARGEYAKAIRKAVHDSIESIKNGKVSETKSHKYHFEWRVQLWNTSQSAQQNFLINSRSQTVFLVKKNKWTSYYIDVWLVFIQFNKVKLKKNVI